MDARTKTLAALTAGLVAVTPAMAQDAPSSDARVPGGCPMVSGASGGMMGSGMHGGSGGMMSSGMMSGGMMQGMMGGAMMDRAGPAMLLRMTETLSLTPEQVDRLEAIHEEFVETRKAHAEDARGVLTDEQREELESGAGMPSGMMQGMQGMQGTMEGCPMTGGGRAGMMNDDGDPKPGGGSHESHHPPST